MLYLLVTGELYVTGNLTGHVSQLNDEWSPRVPATPDDDAPIGFTVVHP